MKEIRISDKVHELCAYETATLSTSKGIIRGIPLQDNPATIDGKIVRPGPSSSPWTGTGYRILSDSDITPMSVQHRATSSVGDAACKTPMSSISAPQNARSAAVRTLPRVKNVRIDLRRRTSFADDASSVPDSKSSSPHRRSFESSDQQVSSSPSLRGRRRSRSSDRSTCRRGSRSRSASRSRLTSLSRAHFSSRGLSKSRTGSDPSNRTRSKTPTRGKGKSSLTWADRVRGNQTQAYNSQDSHDPRLTNELEELRPVAVKRRALDDSRGDETVELLSELKNAISNIQTGLYHVQEMIAHPQLGLVALSARILRLEGTSQGILRYLLQDGNTKSNQKRALAKAVHLATDSTPDEVVMEQLIDKYLAATDDPELFMGVAGARPTEECAPFEIVSQGQEGCE
ncbi:hypothetical protein HPB49_002314 [Dermacentor silvarum]|uniref:Uncharacterized protein n=1 Tax=Dermacentor silvarum TaxID=543639 RepID=A0ACB8DSR2_DERSI|nr:hypothetical protein HPB49_002314 [Dermacentor silvarum]